MKNVIIIGGGFSGITAAINLKKNINDLNVTILEKNDRIGKKILVTGNGKCNYTNKYVSSDKYNHPEFMNHVIEKYNYESVVQFMLDLGMLSRELTEGRTYPITEQASTLLNTLRKACDDLGVNIQTSQEVININKENDSYLVKTINNTFYADYIIYSVGGSSYKEFGTDGKSFKLIKDLGVKVTNLKPGLVGLKVEEPSMKVLDGLRMKANVSLYNKENKVFTEYGEVQFKKDGISGIVVMNAASFLHRQNNNLTLELDLLPDIDESNLNSYILDYGIEGILPTKLIQVINKLQIKDVIKFVKHFKLTIIGDYGFDNSQVTIGGIDIKEVNDNFSLIKYPNIYVIGEALDIDGDCGGYNIHYAIASALIASHDIIDNTRRIK